MAEALTGLGAAAAASQFLVYSVKITFFMCELYGRLQDAPENVREQASRIQELGSVAETIKANPSLQNDAVVKSTLEACTDTAKLIQGRLEKTAVAVGDGWKKKRQKAVMAVFAEKDIVKLFGKLEGCKSTLSLCIASVDV